MGREEGKGRVREGMERGERPYTPPVAKSWLRHWNKKNMIETGFAMVWR